MSTPAWLYGVALDFVVDTTGVRDRAKASALLRKEAASSDLIEALWLVRSSVRAALLDTVASQLECQLLTALVQQREALGVVARTRFEAGAAGSDDVSLVELATATARQRLVLSQQRELDGRQRFAAAVGLPAEVMTSLSLRWEGWQEPQLPEPISQPDSQLAVRARPELIRAQHELELADVDLDAELRRRWPELRLAPGYARDHGSDKVQLGLGLNLPWFNGNRGPIAEALARRDLAAAHVRTLQAQLQQQFFAAWSQWPSAVKSWQEAKASEQRLLELVRSAEQQLGAGIGDRPQLLTAEAAAIEGRLTTLAAALEAQRAIGRLEDAWRMPFPDTGLALKGGLP